MTKIWQDVKGVRGWINELRGNGLTLASGDVLVNGPDRTSAMAYRMVNETRDLKIWSLIGL
jgi:hypothetical protein